jgi:hypothetical protein
VELDDLDVPPVENVMDLLDDGRGGAQGGEIGQYTDI